MPVRTCDHLKQDGVYCGSPALKGRNYCYFHLDLRGRRLKAARARRRGDNPALDLPFPEDMHAVQVSLAEIMWALAEDRIDTKRAGLLLYMLQQASTNLNHTPGWQGQREAVPATRPLRALTDPNFEQRFGLPPNIDLNTDPAPTPPPCHPERECAEQSAFESKDLLLDRHPEPAAAGAEQSASESNGSAVSCHPERRRPSLAPESRSRRFTGVGAGSRDPERAERVEGVASPVEASSNHNPPDRVPVPEDQLRELKMTHWEKLEFFMYRLRFDRISDEQEQQLKVAWLRDKRRRTQEEFAAAQRDGSEDASAPMDGPDYTDTKQMPFGFGNMLEDQDDDEEEAA